MEAGLCQDDRDVHVLVLGKGLDLDVDAVFIGLRDDLDVIRIVPVGLLAVGADIDRAGRVSVCHVGDNL